MTTYSLVKTRTAAAYLALIVLFILPVSARGAFATDAGTELERRFFEQAKEELRARNLVLSPQAETRLKEIIARGAEQLMRERNDASAMRLAESNLRLLVTKIVDEHQQGRLAARPPATVAGPPPVARAGKPPDLPAARAPAPAEEEARTRSLAVERAAREERERARMSERRRTVDEEGARAEARASGTAAGTQTVPDPRQMEPEQQTPDAGRSSIINIITNPCPPPRLWPFCI